MERNRWVRFVLLAAQAMLLGGCATSAVWQEGQFARFHEPAVPSHLSLSHSSQRHDVLVVYDESREGSESVRRRAYWLDRNAGNVGSGHAPSFVSSSQAEGLLSIPVTEGSPPSGSPALHGLYAVASTNSPGFTLFSPERELGFHQLPVYADSSGRVKQVLLTPFAVVADVTIVGAVFLYVTFPSWMGSLSAATR